jgi:glycosyltransferase involved in cell wall biosynthesis
MQDAMPAVLPLPAPVEEAIDTDRAPAAVPPVRVCMVSFYFHPDYSGSSIQALNLSAHLRPLGVQPFIVSANLGGHAPVDEHEGIRVYRIPVVRRRDLQIPSFWVSLAAFLVRHRAEYDVIHAHGTMQHGSASLCGRLLNKPALLKVAMAGSDIAFHRQGRLWGAANRFMVSRFSRYIATTEAIAGEFAAQGLDTGKVLRVPNGVDTSACAPLPVEQRRELRRRLGIPAEGPLVTFVGIVNSRKNVDGILRIWQQAVAAGAPGHLALVGPVPLDTPAAVRFNDGLQAFVRAHQLEGRVTFTGYRSDVPACLQASDVFLFPSRQEGMPNSVLEAMACGLPCVVSASAGVEQVVQPGVEGFGVDVADEAGFTRALESLLRDPALRARMGAAARATAVERFSLAAIARRYAHLYRELASVQV